MHALGLWEVFESELRDVLASEPRYSCEVIQSILSLALESGQLDIALRAFMGREASDKDQAAQEAIQGSLAADLDMSSEPMS
eukprot:6287947-Pyramimonas_sp.AAC.1